MSAKLALGHPLGNPDPVMVYLPPAVEITVGALAVIAPFTTKEYELLSPTGSVLTFTSYYPLSTSGRVKTIEVAEEEDGVTLLYRPVFLLVRMTRGEPRLRFVPLRVMLPVVIVLVDMLVRDGDCAKGM